MPKPKQTKTTKTAKQTDARNDVPEGFEPLQGERVVGWFYLEEGNSVQGFLKDTFQYDGAFGTKKVYKILLSEGTSTKVVTNEGELVDVGGGALIGLDERGWLKRLADVEKNTEVFARCEGKEPPNKANRMKGAWKFTLGMAAKH